MQSEIEFCDEGAILSAKEPLGDGLAHLTFQAPRIAKAARPGQFVMLYPLSEARSHDPLLGRPMAIAGASGGAVEICLSVAGRGTEIIYSLPIGARCRMRARWAPVFRRAGQNYARRWGIGLPPHLRSCLLWRVGILDALVMGILIRVGSFVNWVSRRVQALHVWSDDGSIGEKGSAVDAACALYSGEEIWTCGPVTMLRSLVRRIPEARISASLERRMACGYGGVMAVSYPPQTALSEFAAMDRSLTLRRSVGMNSERPSLQCRVGVSISDLRS